MGEKSLAAPGTRTVVSIALALQSDAIIAELFPPPISRQRQQLFMVRSVVYGATV